MLACNVATALLSVSIVVMLSWFVITRLQLAICQGKAYIALALIII